VNYIQVQSAVTGYFPTVTPLSAIGHLLDFGTAVAGIGTHRIEGWVNQWVDHFGTISEAVAYVEV